MFQLVCIWITTWGVERLWTNEFFWASHFLQFNSFELCWFEKYIYFCVCSYHLKQGNLYFGTFKLCYHFPLITILSKNHLKVYFYFCEFGLMLIILYVHVCNNICITNLLIDVFYIVLICPLSYICPSMSK